MWVQSLGKIKQKNWSHKLWLSGRDKQVILQGPINWYYLSSKKWRQNETIYRHVSNKGFGLKFPDYQQWKRLECATVEILLL